jgi:dTMP kinase
MLYVFEGPDSVGKSTISTAFAQRLSDQLSGEVRRWTFPGRDEGTLGWAVYRMHHKPAELGVNSLTATSLQLLHIAAHMDAIESRILPALESGKVVVLDRFWWSTLVYGIVSGASTDALLAMIEVERKAWRGVQPSVAFIIDREKPFRLRDDEPIKDWQRLRDEYRRVGDQESRTHRVIRIQNDDSVDAATAAAFAATSSEVG